MVKKKTTITKSGVPSDPSTKVGREPTVEGLQARLSDLVNRHGFAFQYSVVESLRALHFNGQSQWRVMSVEVPVPSKPNGSRLDVLMEANHGLTLVAGECKRINPSHQDWVFFRAPFIAAGYQPRVGFVETVQASQYGDPATARSSMSLHEDPVHLGFEVDGDARGEGAAPGKGAIESSLSQAVGGANGLFAYLASGRRLLSHYNPVAVIPVLFTTARLWVSDAKLGRASLIDGKVDIATAQLDRVGALVYNYHVSPMMRHGLSGHSPGDLQQTIELDYYRSIVVVNGLELPAGLSLVNQLAGIY